MFLARILPALALCAAVHVARADTCEGSFQKKGNPFIGTTYSASVRLQGLTVDSAIGQMRGIAIAEHMDVLSEDAANGSLLVEERESMAHKPIPVIVAARRDGDTGVVEMTVKTNPGALASGDAMKKQMCSMLGRLQAGPAGDALAAKARSANATAEVLEFDAFMLAAQFERQGRESPAALQARFKGKTLRIKGRADGGAVAADDGSYRLAFDVADPTDHYDHRQLVCIMAPDQAAFAMSAREGDRMTLTGTFLRYDIVGPVFWVENCRSGR